MKENDQNNASRKNRVFKLAQAVLWFGCLFSVYHIIQSRHGEELYTQRRAPPFGRHCNLEHATTPTNDKLFAEDNFDWTEKSPCGWNKCFFKLKNRDAFQNDNVGYLVLQNDSPEDMWCQYSATKYLEQQYNISHLLLSFPQEINISKHFAQTLNANSYMVIDRPEERTRYSSDSSIVIERVRVAPNPSILIGCTGYKLQYLSEHWESFMSTVVHQDVFFDTLLSNLKVAKQLLELEPWVAPDFQLMVDVNGNTYHIDVVAYGIYSRKHVSTELNKCRAAFEKLFRLIEKGEPIVK